MRNCYNRPVLKGIMTVMFAIATVFIGRSQTTINTTHVNNNGASGITFNVRNNNAGPIMVTGVSCDMTGTGAWEILYNTTGIASTGATWSQGAVVAGPNWTSAGTGTITTAGPQTLSSTLSVIIPANSTFGFAIRAGSTGYMTLTAGSVNTFSGGGVDILTGDNIGWGGFNATTNIPVNYPRGFVGGITFVPMGPCVNPPTAGTTTSSANSVCPNANFTLGLNGVTFGSGQTYQWQSAPTSSGPWTNISGATAFNYTTSQTAATFYRCVVTCGTGFANSTPLQVTMNPQAACINYCPAIPTSAIDTEIYGFSIGSYTNTSTCTTVAPGAGSVASRYSNYYPIGAVTTVFPSQVVPISIVVDDCDGPTYYQSACAIWIDFNQNGIFDEPTEKVYVDNALTTSPKTVTGTITIPGNALPGLTGMRVICSETYFGATLTPCLAYSFGETEDYLINIGSLTPCAGTPNAGTTTASTTNVTCPGSTVMFGLSGNTYSAGLNYQWQTGPTATGPWTDVGTPGPYATNYSTVQSVPTLYYRCFVTCANGGATSASTPIMVTAIPQAYTTIPYVESFENGWVNGCATNDIPQTFWKNTPATGNTSWRRDDDGISASWTTPANGMYTPSASDGTRSARFHSYSGSGNGNLDLFVNCNTPDLTKKLEFDYINTTGNDSLGIYLSTDGGGTFTRLDSCGFSAVGWRTKTIYFNSSSATSVIRFIGYGTITFGTDAGIDNIKLNNFPNCTGTPNAGITTASNTNVTCPGETIFLSLTGSTVAGALGYQWQTASAATGPWTDIAGATTATFATVQTVPTLYYRCVVTCLNGGAFSNSNALLVTAVPQPFATIPYFTSFESNWISRCATNDVPDIYWKNSPMPSDPNTAIRREDDGLSAGWGNINLGLYSPVSSHGDHSARFHSYQAASNNIALFDLFINCNSGIANKRLTFDHINTAGTDTTTIQISTDGGNTFYRADSIGIAANWRTKTIYFNSLSPTTVIRFRSRSDFGTTDLGIDNVNIINYPNCATPVSGTAVTSQSILLCAGAQFTLSLNGTSTAAGLTYKWQSADASGGPWTDITPNGTNPTYTGTQTAAVKYYRCIVGCTFSSATSISNFVQINYIANQPYATLPYLESFENDWINGCYTRDLPNQYWKSFPHPTDLDGSWRRDDDGASAGWLNPNLGEYIPRASDGDHSARFHTYNTSSGNSGAMHLYINCLTPSPIKRLMFDYINTSGNATTPDVDSILISTNGGATFTLLDTAGIATSWTTKTIYFTSLSANTVIRFSARSDFGTTDIGVDNVRINAWPNCSGKPVAGTATANPVGNACASIPLTLNVPNASVGNGIIYTWQQSTTAGVWTNVNTPNNATGNSQSISISQLITTNYRCIVRCVLSAQNDTSSVINVTSPNLPGGTYTINADIPTNWVSGPTGNFNSFNDAYNAVKCGITAPVTFLVQNATSNSGIYNEQLIITGQVPNSSAINTITFKGNGNTLKFSSNNTNERAVIKLRGTKYFIFDSLVIDASTGTYGFGVHLTSNADSNTIKKCTIKSNISAGSTSYAGIVISGTDVSATGTGTTTALCDYNVIDSNTVIGGYYGITQTSTFAGGAHGFNRITNNKIQDFYLYGMYINGTYNTTLQNNFFSRPNVPSASVSTFYGIFFTGQSNSALVARNTFTNPFANNLATTSSYYGIYFSSSSAGTGTPNIVRNNLMYGINGNGLIYALYNVGSSNIGYFHNTISLDSTTSTSTSVAAGYYQTGTANTISFINNLITIKRGGTGTKYAAFVTTPFASADNNNYVVGGTGTNYNVGSFSGTVTPTLAAWKTATLPFAIEQNSISIEPSYADVTYGGANYRPTNAGMDNRGTPAGITDDIVGTVRSNTTPDIGAYEFIPTGCTTPLPAATTVIPTTASCQNQLLPVNVTMGSFGIGQTFQWQYSTSNTGPWTNIGGPLTHPDTTIQAIGGAIWYQCFIKCGTATTTSNPVLVTVGYALPTGVYFIRQGEPTVPAVPAQPGVTVFRSFAEAKAAMSCGVTGVGNVIFNVQTGTTNNGIYTEQLKLDSIPGVNANRQIIFNGNGRTIQMPTTVSTNERAVIKLNGADYITFDSLRINSISTGAFGHGVQLINNADSNTFRKCVILASQTTAQSTVNYAGVVINATDGSATTATTTANSMCDGNLFDRDTIAGGYYGITIAGGTALATYVANNRFTNNYISDFYTYGIYSSGTYNTLIEGNMITRPTRNNVIAGYGIYLTTNPNLRTSISKNRITKMFGGLMTSTAGLYGIYSNNVDAQSGNEVTVSNNLLYNLDGAGPVYGIYNIGSDNHFYYHNTISIDNTVAALNVVSAGFYQTTAALGVKFKNNIISVRRATTGLRQGLAFATATSDIESDYNNIIVTGTTGSNVFGTLGTVNYATLAAWKAGTNEDVNSWNIDPFYLDTATGNYRPNILTIDNKGTALGITTDIVNANRHAVVPDMGAYEFTPLPCVNPPVAGQAVIVLPTPNTGTCLEQPLRLNVINSSPMGSLKFQWQSTPSVTTIPVVWTNLGPSLYNPMYDTVTSINRFYRCIVQCGNGTQAVTNIVSVVLNNLLPPGTYVVSATGTEPLAPASGPYVAGQRFTTMQSAVNAAACGISGHVFFDVRGTFNEKISVPYVPGSSSNATVTFRSQNGNPANAVLTNAGTSAQNYILALDSAKYFFFRNMTFTNTDATNGRVVELKNGAMNDSITNCVINTPAATTTTNANAAVFINGLRGQNNVIKGNTINNGSSGIYIAGLSPAIPIMNHLLDSNTINNPYVNGIYDTAWTYAKITRNTINMATPMAPTAYGIYVLNNDSAMRVTNNKINIASSATSNTVYGISINNSDGSANNPGLVTGNDIVAKAANAGSIYGINIGGTTTATPSPFINVWNNTVALKTSNTTSYGLYHGNSPNASYYNNSVNSLAAGTTNSHAAYFNNTTAAGINISNNIFSHKGGGRAMYISVAAGVLSNYNMLYATGATLVQTATPANNHANLYAWKTANFQDLFSMVYSPAFVNDSTLLPDLANPDVWAIHGRGVQITGNNYDHDNKSRPTTLTAGVPDLGAYEFYPTAQPTVLTASPAAPAPNTTQVFYYGTDTVMRIKWRNTAPTNLTVRRFSGVVGAGISAQNLDSMYFYTQVEIPGGGSYNYDANLFYVDSWLGSIGGLNNGAYQIGLGKTSPAAGNPWVVGFNSRNQVTRRMIYEDSLNTNLDKFTGLINPYAPPVLPDQDTSNAGKRFYVAYPINQALVLSSMQMTLYFSAGAEQAHVQVKIGGTAYTRDYIVPANSVLATATTTNPDYIPKAGPNNAYLPVSGMFDQTIRIESDVPIVAYAHVTGSTSSGAAMLMPVGTWGYEYKTLCIEGSNAYSDARPYFYVVADNDNTQVQITPNGPVQNAGMTANVVNTVTMNKGQVLLVIGTSSTQVLTGSVVKSIPNASGNCYPVAVFSGHGRMGINISGTGSGGDFMMQQNFPSTAWGKKYLTAPTSGSANANEPATNIFRIAVKDPTTVVKLNNQPLAPLYNNHYYEYQSNTADLIEADKPVTVAQFTGGGSAIGVSGGLGDPEMIYISPIEQRVKKAAFYRNTVESINVNYLTMIIPKNGLSSLVIRDAGLGQTPDYIYDHPANGNPALRGVQYSVVVKRWTSAQRQVSVESDSAFTGITYGFGSAESYGYNMGTLIKNLGVRPDTLINVNTGSLYNCVGTPFKIRIRTSVLPTSIKFKFSQAPFISPNADVTLTNPVPTAVSYDNNGEPVYTFTLNTYYTFSQPGLRTIPVSITHPDIESCDNSLTSLLNVWVLPAPNVGFQVNFAGCQNQTATFTADAGTSSGINANTWKWGFNNGTTATGQTATFTYPNAGTFYDTLHITTVDGCIKDTVKATVVNPLPVVSTVPSTADSVAICAGGSGSFTVTSTVTGSTYTWFTSATGGTPLVSGGNYTIGTNGTTMTVANVNTKTELWVQGTSTLGCVSAVRKRVVIDVLAPLASTTVSVGTRAVNSVTFTWTAVPNVASYQVSVNGGAFVTPSGPGLAHTVTGLGVLDSARVVVRANGVITCQNSLSNSIKGCSDSQPGVATDSMAVCVNNAPATPFTVQPTPANVTYTWYNALTGGTSLGTGSTYNPGAISTPLTSYSYYVQHTNLVTGCTSALPRKRVALNVLAPLAKAVVTVDTLTGITPTSLTFQWTAVPGAVGGYQVSVDGGPYITPSSGTFGLSHTVSGLLPNTHATIRVKAIGYLPCQESISDARTSKTFTDAVYVPNAFNPNSPNTSNQVLRVYGYVIKTMNFMVFNQWGEKVFETTDQTIGWNGMYKGKPLPSGVYIYVMRWTHINGSVNESKGSISLIR